MVTIDIFIHIWIHAHVHACMTSVWQQNRTSLNVWPPCWQR